jgi:hypothetical protein
VQGKTVIIEKVSCDRMTYGGRGAECCQTCVTRSYLVCEVLVLDKEIAIPALAFSLLSAAKRPLVLL